MRYSLTEMNMLDIYLSTLSNEEYKRIKNKIGTTISKPMPLLSWDIFMESHSKRTTDSKKRFELEQVLSFAKRYKWKNDLNQAFSENDYEALIITDKDQNIIWVNDGFTTMTGYSKLFAINKTPRFLQGKNTEIEAKNRIKRKINLNKPFKDIIVNHRKDNSIYKCEIKIFPLYNETTTHFIAFENKVG